MMEIVEPQKISDLNKSQFPPPSYLLNYAKNHKVNIQYYSSIGIINKNK